MFHAMEIIQAFVAPVVVISANGLLCLAFYNRLAAVVSRTRAINKERFDLAARLSAMPAEKRSSAEAVRMERRSEILHELGHRLFHRTRLIRDALVFLLAAIACMIACSLALGLSPFWIGLEQAALIAFVAGLLVMSLGIVRAIHELWIALEPVVYEHDMMERLEREEAAGQGERVRA